MSITNWPGNRSSALKCKHQQTDSEGNVITTYNPSESSSDENCTENDTAFKKAFSWIKKIFEDDNILEKVNKTSERKEDKAPAKDETPKKETLPRMKEYYTEELLSGNYSPVNKLIFDGDIDKVVWIFTDNPRLINWCKKKADISFLKKLPIEVWELLEES